MDNFYPLAVLLKQDLSVANVRYPVWPGMESIGIEATKDLDAIPVFSF